VVSEDRFSKIGVVVLAGNTKIRKQIRRKKRRGFFLRLLRPRFWLVNKAEFESRLSSKINRDDYIVGENKSFLYLHPDLIPQKNMNFLKRSLYFAGKTGDRIYKKNKRELLVYLSKEGNTAISMVLKAIISNGSVDTDKIVVVGPKKQLDREIKKDGFENTTVIEQGDSIGENILIGKEGLLDLGYDKDHFMVVGGDIPMISPGSIEDFLISAAARQGDPDLYYGLGSRQEMAQFITDHDLDHMGKVGPNRPKKGNFNKFGFPLVDDIPIFGKKDARTNMMIGNIFLYRVRSVDRQFVDRFYSVRKMLANPLTLPYLVWNWAGPLYRASKWRLGITEAEDIFKDRTGISMKVCAVHPEVALDMDSYSDLRRLSALQFHREGKPHDLELDFKNYIRKRKKERKKRRRMVRKDGP
jgi:hypothetical protein